MFHVPSGQRTSRRLAVCAFAELVYVTSTAAFPVLVFPTGTITEQDRVILEIHAFTPTSPAFLYQPTEIVVDGFQILIDVFPDGGIFHAVDSVAETIDLGVFPPGLYLYSVELHPPAYNSGSSSITNGFFIVSGTTTPEVADKIYWTDTYSRTIKRANLDGSRVEVLIIADLLHPSGIALDLGANKMYWADEYAEKIQRANLDGSGVEDVVVSMPAGPRSIAVDSNARKIYWTVPNRRGIGKIQRANLNGTIVEDLIVEESSDPRAIALDLDEGKMYWTTRSHDRVGSIRRANLDGSNLEQLIVLPDGGAANGIALDVTGGKLYWTESGGGYPARIRRADLDGANVEDVVTIGFGQPASIALDVRNGRMYWVNTGNRKLQRSRLDGSDVEDIVAAETTRPAGVALRVPPPDPAPPESLPTLSNWGMTLTVMVLLTGLVIVTRTERM